MDYPLELRPSLHSAARAVNFSSRLQNESTMNEGTVGDAGPLSSSTVRPSGTAPSKTVSFNTPTAAALSSASPAGFPMAGVGAAPLPRSSGGMGASSYSGYGGSDWLSSSSSYAHHGGGTAGARVDDTTWRRNVPTQWSQGGRTAAATDAAAVGSSSSTAAATAAAADGGGGLPLPNTSTDGVRARATSFHFDVADDADDATVHHHIDKHSGRHTVTKVPNNAMFRNVAKGLVAAPNNTRYEDEVDRLAWEQPATSDTVQYFYEKGVGGYMLKHVEFEDGGNGGGVEGQGVRGGGGGAYTASPSSYYSANHYADPNDYRNHMLSSSSSSSVVLKKPPSAAPKVHTVSPKVVTRRGVAAAPQPSPRLSSNTVSGGGGGGRSVGFAPPSSAASPSPFPSSRLATTTSIKSRYPLTVAVREYLRAAGDTNVLFDAMGFTVRAGVGVGGADGSASSSSEGIVVGGPPVASASAWSLCRQYARDQEALLMLFPEAIYLFPSERVRAAYITDVTVHVNCSCPFPCLEIKVLASLPQGVQKRRKGGGRSRSASPHNKGHHGGTAARKSNNSSGSALSSRPPFNSGGGGGGGRSYTPPTPKQPSTYANTSISKGANHSAESNPSAPPSPFDKLSDREIVSQLTRSQLDQQRYYSRIVGFSSEVLLREAVAVLADMSRYSPEGLAANLEEGAITPAPTAAEVAARRRQQQQHTTENHHLPFPDEIPAAPLLRLGFHAHQWGDGGAGGASNTLAKAASSSPGGSAPQSGFGTATPPLSSSLLASSFMMGGGGGGDPNNPPTTHATPRAAVPQSQRSADSNDVDALRGKLAHYRRSKGDAVPPASASSLGGRAEEGSSGSSAMPAGEEEEEEAWLNRSINGARTATAKGGGQQQSRARGMSVLKQQQSSAAPTPHPLPASSRHHPHHNDADDHHHLPHSHPSYPSTFDASALADRVLGDVDDLMKEMDYVLGLGVARSGAGGSAAGGGGGAMRSRGGSSMMGAAPALPTPDNPPGVGRGGGGFDLNSSRISYNSTPRPRSGSAAGSGSGGGAAALGSTHNSMDAFFAGEYDGDNRGHHRGGGSENVSSSSFVSQRQRSGQGQQQQQQRRRGTSIRR